MGSDDDVSSAGSGQAEDLSARTFGSGTRPGGDSDGERTSKIDQIVKEDGAESSGAERSAIPANKHRAPASSNVHAPGSAMSPCM